MKDAVIKFHRNSDQVTVVLRSYTYMMRFQCLVLFATSLDLLVASQSCWSIGCIGSDETS